MLTQRKGIFCLNPTRLVITSLLSISVVNPLFDLEWSDFFLFSLDWRERGCVVPVRPHHFSAKFIWYLQKCVHFADPVWYCIMEEFLILKMTQTVMNNSFTAVWRMSSTTETSLYLLFSLLPLPRYFHSNYLLSGNLLRNCWLESLYGGPSCHFNDTSSKSNYRFLPVGCPLTPIALSPVSISTKIPLLVHFQPS